MSNEAESRINNGVKCAKDSVDLSGLRLTTLPSSISTLTNLNELYLGSNQLTTLPSSISTLTNLNKLYLYRNQLTTLPSSISTLTNLKVLYLSENQLTALPESISTLTNLNELYLSENQLTALPESISTLTNLKVLYLGVNQLTTLPSSISTLTNLNKLYLYGNQLTTLPESISTLTNLNELYLGSNQLTTLPSSISTLTNLNKLYLYGNQLTTLPESISTLTNLNELDLYRNQLTTLPESISTLTKLEVLNLRSNQLTTFPESIAALTNLQRFDLCHNQFTKLPLSIFQIFSSIVEVEGNPLKFVPPSIAEQGVAAIKQYYDTMLIDFKLPQKKIVIVGEGHIGKTSLVKRLKDVWFYSFQPSTRTEGVDIHKIEISKDKYISVWDFAGQEHFLSSHKLYFTKNSVFIVVVQFTDSINVIKDQLSKWLFTIHQLCPDTQVLIVATKSDLVSDKQLQEKTMQLDHAISLLQKELELNIVHIAQRKHVAISNEKLVNISQVTELLQEISKKSTVQAFWSSIGLLDCIRTCKELCIGVKQLASLSDLPLQHCMHTLKHLEELGMVVYVESNADDEDATVILNGDLISKAFNKLKMKGRELTQSELTGWIDYNLAKSTVSPKIKFKMFIDVIEKAKLIYVDRQSDDETQWKIFIPHIAMDNQKILFSKDSASFSAGRLFYFKHQLPIGFFEHLAIQMQFFVKSSSYSMMMSLHGIKIVGNASAVFIERIKLDGEFVNAIRITTNNNVPQLLHEAIESFEESMFAYFKNEHDIHKFVKRLVMCSCQHCQAKFKTDQLTKHQYLPLTQDDTIQEGTPSILTQYIKGQKASGCIDSDASIPLTDLLFELQLLADCKLQEPSKQPMTCNCVEHLKTMLEVFKKQERHRILFKSYNQIQLPSQMLNWSTVEQKIAQNSFASKEELKRQLQALGLTIRDNAGSGDCLPYSLIDHLKVLTDFQGDCTQLRQRIANYVRQNWRHLVETYPDNIGAVISNEDDANQWATQYQQPQEWCDTIFACICACVFRLQVDIFVMTEHQTLERIVFKPVDADLNQQPIQLAYVNQNHFVSVWINTGDEVFCTEQDIPETDLILSTQKLGDGGYGEVWLGKWRGIKVAVKKMKDTYKADSIENELKTLTLLRYKHIVTLYRASKEKSTGNLMLVMEYMTHGSLYDLLFKQHVKMSLADIIQIALDVAKGINFLHIQKPIIIHRDLKSANILLHSNKKRAKIADFGTAKDLHTNVKPNTVIGTVGIVMPPEMMDEQNYDEKVDIFSIGVVLYEMLTNMHLPTTTEPLQSLERIRSNVSNKDLAELIVTCCTVDPKQRPSINTIIHKLKVFKKNMPQ